MAGAESARRVSGAFLVLAGRDDVMRDETVLNRPAFLLNRRMFDSRCQDEVTVLLLIYVSRGTRIP